MVRCWFALAALAVSAAQGKPQPFVGGYTLLNGPEGLGKISLLASQAATLPINRLWISFFSPSMTYVPGSKTLQYTGLNISSSGDFGFANLSAAIKQLQAGGVDVLLSMGGWDFNCFPYAYTRYSVAGYGTQTPNYWKVQEYCDGSVDNASPANEFCYTCEPPSSNETLNFFGIFPEPSWSPTWVQAVNYITANAGGGYAPVWDPDLVPGNLWTDPKTGYQVLVPGNTEFVAAKRDPYQDIVYLAKELGAAGIDLDYEEDWHADYYKYGTGPYTLPQTVYKYAAIATDILINIKAIAPGLQLSTAAPAVGAWNHNWWGGNLLGIIYSSWAWYPDTFTYIASTGGINVMTYDLSDDTEYSECPEPGVCSLDQQVAFYMNTFASGSIPANVGYETGTPAYPDPVENPTHQLPLTLQELATITQQTQPSFTGGFFWEIFKQPVVAGEATPTQVAQAVCKVVMAGSPRCSGTLPVWNATTAP